MKTYKGLDRDMKCSGFQYEIGKAYKDTRLVHYACQNPFDIWFFFPPINGNRFFEVEQFGDIETDGRKTVSEKILIKTELSLTALIKRGLDFVIQKAKSIKETSGDNAPAATNSNCAPAATSGDYTPAATAGYCAPAVTSGDNSPAATAGYNSPAVTAERCAPAVTAGYGAPAVTSGRYSPAATAGDYAPAMTAGNNSPAMAAGACSQAETSGEYSPAVATGDSFSASTTSDNSIACALGLRSRAKAIKGWIILVDWRFCANNWKIKNIYRAKVGQKIKGITIKPDVWYWFDCGKLMSEAAK